MSDRVKSDASSGVEFPYIPPSMRPIGNVLFNRFHGAVKARISLRQKAFWSRFIGAGWTCEDIDHLWPEENLEFFGIRYGGMFHSHRLADCNLRELDAIDEWLKAHITKIEEYPENQP